MKAYRWWYADTKTILFLYNIAETSRQKSGSIGNRCLKIFEKVKKNCSWWMKKNYHPNFIPQKLSRQIIRSPFTDLIMAPVERSFHKFHVCCNVSSTFKAFYSTSFISHAQKDICSYLSFRDSTLHWLRMWLTLNNLYSHRSHNWGKVPFNQQLILLVFKICRISITLASIVLF